MNNIDEIALRVAEKLEPRGRTYSPDYYVDVVKLVLEELRKDAEPSCIVSDTGIIQNVTDRPLEPGLKLFTCPANTAEIEQRVVELSNQLSGISGQLTAEQSKVKVLTDALENLMDMMELPPDKSCSCFISPPCNDCVELQRRLGNSLGLLDAETQFEAALNLRKIKATVAEQRQQLAAEQAYAEQLREELDRLCSVLNDSGYTTERSRKILAVPHDTTALQEYGANLVDRVIDSINSEYHRPLAHIPDRIRKGEF